MSLSYIPESTERASMGDLIRDLFLKMSQVVTTQVEIAKAELKVTSQKLAAAVIFGAITAVLSIIMIVFAGIAVTIILTPLVGLGYATLITTGIYLILAAITAFITVAEIKKNSDTMPIE